MKASSNSPRWWDWTAITLLFLLLQTLASRLVNTSWTPFLYLTQIFATEAVVIGLILGYSQFKPGITRLLSFFYMVILLPLQWTLVIDQQVSLEEQLLSVWGRLYFSVSKLIAQKPVDDPIFFVAVMSIAFWVVSASAGFSLTRYQNYLRMVLPAAVGIMVIQHYDNVAGRMWGLGIFAFLALVLLGRMHYLQNKVSWSSRRVFISNENSLDLSVGMAVLAGLIIFVSFLAPASITGVDSVIKTWNQLTKPWRTFTERFENAVSAVESTGSTVPGEFYGTELQLGRGFPLSDTLMFEVQVPALSDEERPPRYYWRARTYDFFSNGQWYITGTEREEFSPRLTGPTVPNTEERNPRTFVFKVGETKFSLLYAPSEPVWISRPGSYLAAPASTDKDIVTWNASPALLPGEVYEVQAVVKDPNILQLSEAGTEYPEWVKSKYLQMPAGFSPRITDLAKEITANAQTPYDKATAVTQYLRANLKYAPTIPAAPRNRDALEWVLFEHKQAYCVYYASAEVLMLRSLGIPARMAVGFAEGTPETVQGNITNEFIPTSYTVIKKNAHAWPEVYFPGIGWVEFEPTANQAALSRPLPPVDPGENNANPVSPLRNEDSNDFAGRDPRDEEGLTEDAQPITPTVNLGWYLIPLFVALAVLTFFLGRRYNLPARVPVFVRASLERTGMQVPTWVVRWEYWTGLSPIARDFESINFGLRMVDQAAPISSTPAERAEVLAKLLPHLGDPIKILLDEHQTSLYTSRTADANRARRSALQIRTQAVISRIRHFFIGEYAVRS